MRARVAVQQGSRAPITVALAWRRYLVATRTAAAADYERVEERAWERLRSELAFLDQPLPERDL
ncbi:MAG TPA: hypothetical protein VIU44_02000 [Gaiellaceae bacterium]